MCHLTTQTLLIILYLFPSIIVPKITSILTIALPQPPPPPHTHTHTHTHSQTHKLTPINVYGIYIRKHSVKYRHKMLLCYCFSAGFYDSGQCATPSLYMRTYPEWACSQENLQIQLAVLDDSIISSVLANVIPYMSTVDKENSVMNSVVATMNRSNMNPTSIAYSVDKKTARTLLCKTHLFPTGKLLGAVAHFRYGIEDGISKMKVCMYLTML